MTLININGRNALLTRASDAEVLEVGATRITLLADADTTGGALNANRGTFRQPLRRQRCLGRWRDGDRTRRS